MEPLKRLKIMGLYKAAANDTEKQKPNAEVTEKRQRSLRNNILLCVLCLFSATSAFHALHSKMALCIVSFHNPYVRGSCQFPLNFVPIRSSGNPIFSFMNNRARRFWPAG